MMPLFWLIILMETGAGTKSLGLVVLYWLLGFFWNLSFIYIFKKSLGLKFVKVLDKSNLIVFHDV